jgi:hypothetical protein
MREMPKKTSPQTSYTTFFSLSLRILGPEFVLETAGGTLEKRIPNWEATERGKGRIYNKILANFLKTLKVNEDLRQQELAIKIMDGMPGARRRVTSISY